jgi:hypothetical protein
VKAQHRLLSLHFAFVILRHRALDGISTPDRDDNAVKKNRGSANIFP